MNKKAIELSITTLVVIIISLILLIYSIYFVNKIMKGAGETEEQIKERALNELVEIMRDPKEIINIPAILEERQGKIGEIKTVIIGVRNVLESTESFSGLVSFEKATNIAGNKVIFDADADFIDKTWLQRYRVLTPEKMELGEYKKFESLIKVGDRISQTKNTQKGHYLFNICIFTGTTPPADKCSHETKDLFYNKELKTVVISIN